LICALATGVSYRIPVNSPPRKKSGGVSPSTAAPINRNGSAIRFIGRRESEWSPTKVQSSGRLAKSPLSNRIVVPEFPQSSGAEGVRHSAGTTRITWSHSAETPSCRRHAAVERASPPVSGIEISLGDVATEASINARWVSDLSEGGRNLPNKEPARPMRKDPKASRGYLRG
jgi:hypothetical protein